MHIDEINKKITQYKRVAYLDEAGAGPLCGDLVVCGLILETNTLPVKDSKKLSAKKREELYDLILQTVVDYSIVSISPEQIDTINIFNARMLGFKTAIENLNPDYALIDGNKKPFVHCECDTVIKGDDLIPGISAASIIAKVFRDRQIIELSQMEPYNHYGLEKHKGYGTKLHMETLNRLGPIPGFHRTSYKPVKNALR